MGDFDGQYRMFNKEADRSRRAESVGHLDKVLTVKIFGYHVQFIVRKALERLERLETIPYLLTPQRLKSILVR